MSVIHGVAADKVGSGNMFTAFEISLAVQAELKTRGIFDYNLHRHRHIKEDVHGVLETYILNGSYNRVLQDVGATDPAYVYHPAGSDPQMYVPMPRKDSPATPATAPDPTTNQPTSPASPASYDDGRKPDERGSVTVSAAALRDAGLIPGDIAYVFQDQFQGRAALFVSKNLPSGNVVAPITTYTVNGSGNVRITKFVFEYVNMVAQLYDFEVNGDQVVVLPK